MKFNKIFAVIATISLTSISDSKGLVSCIFFSDNYCVLECNGKTGGFYSIEDLSNNINNFTKDYFTVSSISKDVRMGTIYFNNFNNTNNEYTLSIQGSDFFHPYIILNYNLNNLIFPNFYHNNILSLKIYSCNLRI